MMAWLQASVVTLFNNHCGIMTPYDVMNFGHRCLRWWFPLQHQAITWINGDILSVGCFGPKNKQNTFEIVICKMAVIEFRLQCVKQWYPWVWFNIKMPSYQYRTSNWGTKTISWLPYVYKGISYTGKMRSLYWIWPLVNCWVYTAYQDYAYGFHFWRFDASQF